MVAWLVGGGMILSVLTGVSLGLFTRPPLGRGWLRK